MSSLSKAVSMAAFILVLAMTVSLMTSCSGTSSSSSSTSPGSGSGGSSGGSGGGSGGGGGSGDSGGSGGGGGSGAGSAAGPVQYVYTADAQSRNISGFIINDKNRTLTVLPNFPVATGLIQASLATSKNFYCWAVSLQRLLASCSFIRSQPQAELPRCHLRFRGELWMWISAYACDPKTGMLAQVPGSPYGTGQAPASIVVAASM
jgi:hypothetical protein